MNLPHLSTGRLFATLLQPGMEQAMVDFLQQNSERFAPWDPPAPDAHCTIAYWEAHTAKSLSDITDGSAVRFVLCPLDAPTRIIGSANYSQISRGPFQAAFLGYKIAAEAEGKGLMHEALQATNGYMFDTLRLHRIHANYLPQNVRSGRLLARLGFTIEGYAKNYLFINGAWRDHVLTSLTNQRFDANWLASGIPAPAQR
jgi:[ribosomal protein S5]-alanine N-acetyltransferase